MSKCSNIEFSVSTNYCKPLSLFCYITYICSCSYCIIIYCYLSV
nr:MAG TPA: hypothetical protein [Caudoviricetes sp.]